VAKKEQKKETEKSEGGGGKPGIKGLLTNKKLLLIVGAALVVCLAAGVAGVALLSKSKSGSSNQTAAKDGHGETKAENADGGQGESKAEGEEGGHGGAKAEGEKGGNGEVKEGKDSVFDHVYFLQPFELKLADPDRERILKLSMCVEMDNPGLATEFNDRKEMIFGALRSILAARTSTGVEGAEARILLKMELIAELNRRLETGKVRNIYFTDFIIM
jgi:flagellar basal body-associated protein FliL